MTWILWCVAVFTTLCTARPFGAVPISFEPNQGQTDPRVRYLARTGGITVFITRDGYTLSAGGQSVSMRIAGAARKAHIAAEQPVEGLSNYYAAGRAAITGVPHFDRVRANRVRPGIDAIFYGRDQRFEYDFLLQPGADPQSITLRFTGAGNPIIDANGDLILRSGNIEFRHHKPVASQGNQNVQCAYGLLPDGAVRFKLGAYDKRRALTIDPVLSYSTYLGGAGADTANAIVVDSSGSAYVAGNATSVDFPVTSGTNRRGAFVTKLNPSGTALVYSTLIGGASGLDTANGIAVDQSGNAYVAGVTSSPDLPGYVGGTDILVAKLGPTGTVVYTKVLGGSGDDRANAIAVDATGAAYITGSTSSSGLATTGAPQNALAGDQDVFVAKLTPSGAVSYLTYLGGANSDSGNAVAVDGAGNTFVAGQTCSTDFPITADALGKGLSGVCDAFMTVLNPNGAARTYSSYLGGSGKDSAGAIALDGSGAVYIAGNTLSADLATAPGAMGPAKPSGSFYNSGFVAKFVHSQSWSASYSTYFGGTDSNDVTVRGIAVDASAQAIVFGSTNQSDFPTTPGALKRAKNGSYDADLFLTQFNAAGNSILYSTLLGGTRDETAGGLALDANGAVYIAGGTVSDDYPTTPGAFQTVNPAQPNNGVNGPAVISKIDFSSPASCVPQITPTSASVAPYGGMATFQLTLAPGCPWAVVADPGVTVGGAQTGMGSLTPITFNVSATANDSTSSARTLNVKIGSAIFAVNQPAWSCTDPVVDPVSLTFDSAGGIRTIAVSLPSSCSWTAAAGPSWIGITAGANGSGPRSVSVSAAPNSVAVARSGSITVAGKSIPVTQTAGATVCTYSVSSPAPQPSAGGAFSIGITAAPDCPWQAALSGSAPWITINGAQGSGAGAVSITLARNTGPSRTATLIIAGQSVAVTQAGLSATYSDFNKDGVPDLVWMNDSTRQVTVHYSDGSWNWLSPSGASGWRVAAIADFNGDGVPDLVWQNEATGQASVHYHGGSGGAIDQGWNWLYTATASDWKIVAAADFNSDGVPDLVWQNEATRQVSVHYYGGSGGAVDQGWNWLYTGSAPGWRVVAAADFNGDGVPELVWQNEATRQVSVHYYGGSGGAVDQGWKWLNTTGAPGWKVKAAADFNGDGAPDLVWMNDTTRQVTVHYYGGADGTVYQGWNWLNSSGAQGWTLAP